VAVEEGKDAIVEEISSRDRRLAIVELGESDLGIGVDERLLVDAPEPLQVADVEGYPRRRSIISLRSLKYFTLPVMNCCASSALVTSLWYLKLKEMLAS
jgi:hypothetical protein